MFGCAIWMAAMIVAISRNTGPHCESSARVVQTSRVSRVFRRLTLVRLPVDGLAVSEEAARRSVATQGGGPYDAARAFLHAELGIGSPQVRAHPARAHRVDLDLSVRKLLTQDARECIQRGLRNTIWRGALAHVRQLPHAARYVHDCARAVLTHQRHDYSRHPN